MRKPVSQVVAKADKNHNVVGPERHAIGEREQEWASKDRHDVGRRRQVEFTDRMADDRCATGDEHAFDGRVTQTQLALHGEQVLVGQFDLEVTDMPFDLLQGGLLPLDAVGGCADGIFQRRKRGGRYRR